MIKAIVQDNPIEVSFAQAAPIDVEVQDKMPTVQIVGGQTITIRVEQKTLAVVIVADANEEVP